MNLLPNYTAETPQRIPLASAEKIAEKICEKLSPYCERIQIAGSIRRRRETVGDIDIVILPKFGKIPDIKTRCVGVDNGAVRLRDGDENFTFRLKNGYQVDLFFAAPETRDLLASRPGTLGTILLCRTGSKEHNIYILEHAKSLGKRWHPYTGLYDIDPANGKQTHIASETEEDIFRALQLPFIPPEQREK